MDKNTVPARIVIVGTSTMKLADRFSNLEREMSARKPKSFLYDDYMDNTMYADEIAPRSRRPVRNYQDLDQFEDEEVVVSRPRGGGGMRGGSRGGALRSSRPADPIYGVDGTVFSAPREGRGGGARTGGGIRRRHPAYALLDENPRRRAPPRGRVREEIIEYVTEPVRSRRPATRVIRRAAPRTQTITRIVKRPAFKKTIGKPRVARGKPKKEDVRGKMGTDDLDRELDAYMKTSKHPRVEATTIAE
uniref:Chromatin target of PRMT1 protein C-terminal domain-containing protein n=1 Tax=Panagrolaimus superbus TaxID=310955 RepID=A0A914YVL9_9BILA